MTSPRRALAPYSDSVDQLQGDPMREVTLAAELRRAERENARLRERLAEPERIIADLTSRVNALADALGSMQASRFWWLRNRFFDLKHALGLHPYGAEPPIDGHVAPPEHKIPPYELWLDRNEFRRDRARLLRAAIAAASSRPLISVLMPVHNTPPELLRAAIESVAAQVYERWELCIADDASTLDGVRDILERYKAMDGRIRVVYREENGHIAAATNSALGIATGEFVTFLDHDDELPPDALAEVAIALSADTQIDVLYTDEDKIGRDGLRFEPYFKPDWSPNTLLSRMYMGHLTVYRRTLVAELGGLREGFEGSQDYDLALRAVERARRIAHIPRVLYHWRVHDLSAASGATAKSYAYEAGRRAVADALERRGEPGRVESIDGDPGIYRIRYALTKPGRVEIIIPTRDAASVLERCLDSIFGRTRFDDFRVTVIDNGSVEEPTARLLETWKRAQPSRFSVIRHDAPFNYSELNNLGVARTDGPYVLLLNNDTEVVSRDWLEAMMEQAQRPSVGAVGAKLLYPDGSIQHAGVVMRIGGVAGHAHKYRRPGEATYFNGANVTSDVSAVTGACLMVRRELYTSAGGLDETLPVAFNDVDFCLKLRGAGLHNIYLPHVVLYHHESKSRGLDDTPEKAERSAREQAIMQARWRTADTDDPYYNPNLSIVTEDFAIRP